jgi:hypothetical protein
MLSFTVGGCLDGGSLMTAPRQLYLAVDAERFQ